MNKKTGALILALGLSSLSGMAVAEPQRTGWTPIDKICFLHNGTIYPTIAAAGEYKTVYGPYSGKCATSYHKFNVSGMNGGWLPVVVERLEGGVWQEFRVNVFNPAEQFGAGTFRIMFDNRRNPNSARIKGTFSVPL